MGADSINTTGYFIDYQEIISLINDLVMLPGDAFIGVDKESKLIRHYIIYLEEIDEIKYFIINDSHNCIVRISQTELENYSIKYHFKGVIFYKGSMFGRRKVVRCGKLIIGKSCNDYNIAEGDIISYLHSGKHFSYGALRLLFSHS